MRVVLAAAATATLLLLSVEGPALAATPSPFFNGFETDTSGWFDLAPGSIERQPSGYANEGGYAARIASASGNNHARLDVADCRTDCAGPYTDWGGYTDSFPPGGYTARLAIYLDVAWAAQRPHARFDWDVASSDDEGGLLRDLVFNAGTTPRGQGGPSGFVINASTNATPGSSDPSKPCPSPSVSPNGCRAPAYITTSGWYTFVHDFSDGGEDGLRVDMSILDGSGGTVASWTIYPGDPMAAVGGNRYGWFANQEVDGLPVDDSSLELDDTTPPTTTIDSAPAARSASPAASFTFSGADAGGSGLASFQCRLDSDPEAWQACASPTVYEALADGTHRFEVRAVDLARNADPSPAAFSWTITTTPPTTTPPTTTRASILPPFAAALGPSVLSPPAFGQTANAEPVSGTVRVKLRGAAGFRVLRKGEQIPLGSILDTRKGRVRLTSAKRRNGSQTQTADFYGGVFRLLQPSSGWPRTVLKLVDEFGRLRLGPGRVAFVSRRRNGRRRGHRRNGLWGDGHGNFVTRGRHGSATVRGTIWFTQDRPDGTFFKVRRNTVRVRDFTRGRTIRLRAGRSYLAPAR